MKAHRIKLPLVALFVTAALGMAEAQVTPLIHYRVKDTDTITTTVPNIGSLGDGTISGSPAITLSTDLPTSGVPGDAGNRSMSFPGSTGIIAPGTMQLLNDDILTAGGFTYEAWFKYTGGGTINSIIDYAGTEKIARPQAGTEVRMQTNATLLDPIAAAAINDWHYVAVVFHNVTSSDGGTTVTGDYTYYFDGICPVETVTGVTISDLGDSLNRTIGVGMHPQGLANDFFNGLIYEPRVTLAGLKWHELLFEKTPVVTNSNDSGAGSLRAAIAAASSGDCITFASSLNGQTITLTSGQLVIDESMTIDATNLAAGLTIDANGAVTNHRVMEIDPGLTVVLSGLTLTGGSEPTSAGGGGIYNDHATLTLNDCTLMGNSAASFGGAISNDGSSGVANLTLNGCTLTNNSTINGGAIYNNGTSSGSAIINLNSCTVTENSATNGGAIINNGGSSKLTLDACTVVNNAALTFGGGVYNIGGSGETVVFNVINSILADNTAPTGPDVRDNGAGVTSDAVGRNLISSTAGSTLNAADPEIIITANPLLAPLAHYGGQTQTMPPLANSPAIDVVATTDEGGLDQRGFLRIVNGALDIGAVEIGEVIVVNDAGDNPATATTLRKAIDDADTPGTVIRFDPTVFNGEVADVITLTNGQLLIDKSLFIEASNIPEGVTIDANGEVTNHRVLLLNPEKTLALHGLTLTGGQVLNGGAINNDGGILSLSNCAILGNSANNGGGIYSLIPLGGSASLTLKGCTLSGNSADNSGGGIYHFSSSRANLILEGSTLSGNTAGSLGGAIFSYTNSADSLDVSLRECTLSGNSAGNIGGGIYTLRQSGAASLTLILTNSILAGNSATTGPDLSNGAGITYTLRGKSLVSTTAGSTLNASAPELIVADPILAPLAHYGGPTMTMPPLANSPAIDAAGSTDPGGLDQRGFSRFVNGALDIGAVELGPVTVVNDAGDNPATATTLRKAIADASTPGAVIRFDPTVFNGEIADVITLTNGQLLIDKSLFIEASNIPNGVTIDANGAVTNHRVMQLNPGHKLALHGLTLTGGKAVSATPGNYGGGIYNDHGTLSLSACTLAGNDAFFGGGIYNGGNSGGNVSLALQVSTLSDNTAISSGGGIYNFGVAGQASVSLLASTLSDNSAANGGGIYNYDLSGSAPLMLRNSILAGNRATSGPDLKEEGLAASHLLQGMNLVSSTAGSSLNASAPELIVADPHLAPLAHYGGPTLTMPPLANSPAINAAGVSHPGGQDQRGFPRIISVFLDIGAVELGPVTVVNNAGDNVATATTLRKAIADSNTPGAVIRFDPVVFNGETADMITLTSGQLAISKSLFIDASNIPEGVTIDANGPVTNHRVIQVNPGHTLALHGLTLTGGKASGVSPSDYGGGIYNDRGKLSLSSCTIWGNAADERGGGVYSEGFNASANLMLHTCTLTANSSSLGGGIFNHAGSAGSAILTLKQCSLSRNPATNFGGGIYSFANFDGDALFSLTNSIVAGNTAPSGPDLRLTGVGSNHTLHGKNLVSSTAGSGFSGSDPGLIVAASGLSPLGDHGGAQMTMIPLPISSAIDMAVGSTAIADQRGLPIVGTADIGAAEYQGTAEFIAIWSMDHDGDGNVYGVEIAQGTDPATSDPAVFGNFLFGYITVGQPAMSIGHNEDADSYTHWIFERSSPGLDDFQEIFRYNGPTDTITSAAGISVVVYSDRFQIEDTTPPVGQAFYRFRALLVP